jgi:MscS family membrane protein
MNVEIEQLGQVFSNTGWIVQCFIVVFITLMAAYISGRLLDKLHERLKTTKTIWDDALLVAARRPLRFLIWILGITFAVEIVYKESGTAILSAIYPIRDVSIIAVLGWFIDRFIKEVRLKILHENKADRTTLDAIVKILRATVVITVSLVILQTLGFSVSGVMAFGGVGGIAIGFAAKDLLANFFGAMMIYFDRPFVVGDWIRSPDKEIEGTVEDIGWRQTRIRTFDKRPLYVPNSLFSTIAVENPSRMTHRRIYETIGVRYDDIGKLDKIVEQVKEMLLAHEEIDTNQTMIVNVNSFGPSSVDFFIYTFTKTTDWIKYHGIKHDVLLKVNTIIEGVGAEIAYPTSTVHLSDPLKMHLSEGSKKELLT